MSSNAGPSTVQPPTSLTYTAQTMVKTDVSQAIQHMILSQSSQQNRFKPARIFKGAVDPPPPGSSSPRGPNTGPRQITGMSFDDRGDVLITAAEDETFRLYNCKTGKYVAQRFRLPVLANISLQASEDFVLKEVWRRPASFHTQSICDCVRFNERRRHCSISLPTRQQIPAVLQRPQGTRRFSRSIPNR